MSDEDPRARLESLEREIEHLRRENQRLLEVHRGDSSVSDGCTPPSARSLGPIAEALPHLVWIWGPGGVEYYNRRFVEYTGRTLETGRNVSWLEWVHPDDREQAGRTFMSCQRTGDIFECEERVRGVDGEYRWFLSRAWPLLGPDGRPERWFGALTDIDLHKRNEAALANLYEVAERERRRMERLQAFTAKLSAARTIRELIDAIVTEGRVSFGALRGVFAKVVAEQGALEIVCMEGFSEEMLAVWLGRRLPLVEALPLTDAVRLDAPVCLGNRISIEARYPEFARRILDVEAMLVLPIRAGGCQLGALGLMYDAPTQLTDDDDQREMQTFARLAGQALERGHLFDAARAEMRRAEEANHAKDLFLGMMSHELRTPLTAILGWATILRARVPPPETLAKAILVIERNARAQAQLIDDLLDVTKILAGSMRIEVQDVDPLAVAEEAIDAVRPSATAKGVEIIRALDAGVRPLRADPARLKQVVWNLLSNAVKFTPAGGQVFVSLDGDESHVEFAVEDTGKGIPIAFLPHVFEPFRQADVGTTRAYGGLGLGLAIVSHLVELHGGVIEVTSKGEGKGARFVVRLPRKHDSSSISEGAPPLHGLGRAPGPSLEGHRILVIDDEPDVLEMLSSYLSSRGATVLVAASAAEGLGKIKESRPDVVVCDIGMPGQDGYGFIEELRSSSPAEGSATPVVALTAYARPEDRSRAILHGFDTHVAKPLDPGELASVIERLSTSKAAARSRAG
ncbi:ATP-binding protein [Polyangium sp. y55x31]|uniref:ATP-binding protein n=1 Tax=Polyangium sp. y55x31 TaxID=3042688 RepID=UPI00248303C4|nr:ATP-binding protein [Polyangium sp. y55x31]MDI1484011.1 ATP-binding protein [Polyangium sp. y55x31]